MPVAPPSWLVPVAASWCPSFLNLQVLLVCLGFFRNPWDQQYEVFGRRSGRVAVVGAWVVGAAGLSFGVGRGAVAVAAFAPWYPAAPEVFWLWRRSWSASRKWRRKRARVLVVSSFPRHSRQATSNKPVELMMLYPIRITDASLGASLPAVAKRMPTFS